MNFHAHNFTLNDPTNKLETMPDRNHPIFADESLRDAALYYDRKIGDCRHLFGDEVMSKSELSFGNSTTSPIGIGILRGYYFTTREAAIKAHSLVTPLIIGGEQ